MQDNKQYSLWIHIFFIIGYITVFHISLSREFFMQACHIVSFLILFCGAAVLCFQTIPTIIRAKNVIIRSFSFRKYTVDDSL